MKIKKAFKNNFYLILLVLFSLFFFLFPLPFTIEGPGGLIDVKNRFQIKGKENNSHYFLAYVTEYKATPMTYLHAKLHKNYEIISKSEQVGTDKEANFRNHLMLEEANQDALLYAYLKADKEVNILKEDIYVTYIDETAKTNLQVGDKLVSIDGETIKDKNHLFMMIQEKNVGDTIDIVVEYHSREIKKYATIIEVEEKKKIGFLPTLKRVIEVEPNITFVFDKSESGSSGGFMMTLAIYDTLTNAHFSENLKIAGTGTIDSEGNIGEIGGIQYKILGAIKEKADIFFVPDENYEEALKTLKENKGNLELIRVSHFDEALAYLEDRKNVTE